MEYINVSQKTTTKNATTEAVIGEIAAELAIPSGGGNRSGFKPIFAIKPTLIKVTSSGSGNPTLDNNIIPSIAAYIRPG